MNPTSLSCSTFERFSSFVPSTLTTASYPLTFTLLLFFFNDTATTEIYTLSLPDALPICLPNEGDALGPRTRRRRRRGGCILLLPVRRVFGGAGPRPVVTAGVAEIHPIPEPAVEPDVRLSQVGPRSAELATPQRELRPDDVAGGRRRDEAHAGGW